VLLKNSLFLKNLQKAAQHYVNFHFLLVIFACIFSYLFPNLRNKFLQQKADHFKA